MPWDLSDRLAFKRDLAISLILLIVSFVSSVFISVSRVRKIHRTKSWIATKCIIESKWLDADRSSETTIFFWNTNYTYVHDGQKYTSNRYNILKKHRILTEEEHERIYKARMKYGYARDLRGPYSQGEETICFVNPDNPKESVLNRKYTFSMFINGPLVISFTILIASLFCLIRFIRTYHY
ncbi:MAG: DUF3592 domain-containing protein [Promethearchaeota archaeon]|jgi:hypothetical protein